jgi:hypothetical protein
MIYLYLKFYQRIESTPPTKSKKNHHNNLPDTPITPGHASNSTNHTNNRENIISTTANMYMNQYEFIKANITQNELDIRKNLIDSYQLKEENYPNSNALIEDLEKLEQTTIDFLVSISSHPFWLPQNYTSNNQELTKQQKNCYNTPKNMRKDKQTPISPASSTTSPNQSYTNDFNGVISTASNSKSFVESSTSSLTSSLYQINVNTHQQNSIIPSRTLFDDSIISISTPALSSNSSSSTNESNSSPNANSLSTESSSSSSSSCSNSNTRNNDTVELLQLLDGSLRWTKIKQVF